mmetsp:Transcript_4592/g.9904  ORF Transcript_4592/g.9904 Transcript_4592/m.9904 type:complete len:365 (+) Transcript_4592:143-1237(+)
MRDTNNESSLAAKRAIEPAAGVKKTVAKKFIAKKTKVVKKNAPAKKTKRIAPKHTKVPFEEMCRLMKVYGSTKCLRKRNSPDGGAGCTRAESIKRKFYRWFPDLDERFEKDSQGFYRPKSGHEFEMHYRQEMRKKEGESLNKKRAQKRRSPNKEVVTAAIQEHAKAVNDASGQAFTSSILAPISRASPPAIDCKRAFASSILAGAETAAATDFAPATASIVTIQSSFYDHDRANVQDKLEFDQELLGTATIAASTIAKQDFDHDYVTSATIALNHALATESSHVAVHAESLDHSFVAGEGIFDEVEESFFGSNEDCANHLAGINLDEPRPDRWGGHYSDESIDRIMLDIMTDNNAVTASNLFDN